MFLKAKLMRPTAARPPAAPEGSRNAQRRGATCLCVTCLVLFETLDDGPKRAFEEAHEQALLLGLLRQGIEMLPGELGGLSSGCTLRS